MKKKRSKRKDLFGNESRNHPLFVHRMTEQDSNWLAAARLKKIVEAGGPNAKAAWKELRRQEKTPLVSVKVKKGKQ